jgi:hypothetical protein
MTQLCMARELSQMSMPGKYFEILSHCFTFFLTAFSAHLPREDAVYSCARACGACEAAPRAEILLLSFSSLCPEILLPRRPDDASKPHVTI